MQRKLCTLAVVIAGLAWAIGGATPAAKEIMPLAEIARGQQGRGWSVFSGSEPEPFDVEVLGVWRDISPDSSYILARLAGQGLEESGVIAGMSGSPVYVEDRLVGAVAFSWAFAKEPIAGVTPIESMRRMAGSPRRSGSEISQAIGVEDVVQTSNAEARLADSLALLGGGLERRGGLLWSGVGFGAQTLRLLEQAVGPMVAAGQMSGAGGELSPGDAVAAVLIDGDLKLAATGTVTDRIGDTVLAFGHPFLGVGDIPIPMAAAEIVTVIPSLANSFKIGNVGSVIGSFERDRPAGVSGRLGVETPMLPMRVVVRTEQELAFSVRLTPIRPFVGSLAASTLLGAIDTASGAGGDRSIDLTATIALTDRPALELRQSFDGPSASLESAVFMLTMVGFLLNNDLGTVEIESIDLTLDLVAERRAVGVVGAHPSRRVVAPGESLTVWVETRPYREASSRTPIEIELPADLAEGRYVVLVGDGSSIDGARLQLERFAPDTLDQALGFLGGLQSRRQLSWLGVSTEPGLAVSGHVLPRLPGSIRGLWEAAVPQAAESLQTVIRQQHSRDFGRPLQGLARVDLEVKDR